MKRITMLFIAALFALTPVGALCQAQSAEYSIYSDAYAMRGIRWDMTAEEVAEIEGGSITKEGVTVKSGAALYDNPASSLIYAFEDGRMVSRKFTLKSKRDYSTTFYGLFYFYGVPVFRDGNSYTWELPDMQIRLIYGSRLQVVFTVRESED